MTQSVSLKRNIAWLQLLQFSGIVIPLVTQPWIARALGPEGYGRVNFAIALTAYFVLFADFGFNWSATRTLAVHRHDPVRRSQIVCATLAAKALLACGGLLILLAVAALVPAIGNQRALLLLAYAGVIGAVLAPVWYFQGIERPHVTSSIDLVIRLASVPLIIAAIRTPDDVGKTVAIVGGTQLLIGVVGFAVLARTEGIHWQRPAGSELVGHLREGFPLFLSTSAISLYTNTTSVIIGLIAKHEHLAYFSAAQKIVNAANSVFVPINQALYPRVSSRFAADFADGKRLVTRALYIQALIGAIISAGLFLLSDWIVRLLFGDRFVEAAQVLRWMSPIPLLLSCTAVFANLILLPMRQDARHLRMVVGGAATNLLLIVPLVQTLGASGGGIAVCAAELFVVCYSGYHATKLLGSRAPGRSPA